MRTFDIVSCVWVRDYVLDVRFLMVAANSAALSVCYEKNARKKKKTHRPSFVLGNDEARFSDSPSPLRNARLLYSLFFSRSHSSCYLRVQITYTKSLCFFFFFSQLRQPSFGTHHPKQTSVRNRWNFNKSYLFFSPFALYCYYCFSLFIHRCGVFLVDFFFCGGKKKKRDLACRTQVGRRSCTCGFTRERAFQSKCVIGRAAHTCCG